MRLLICAGGTGGGVYPALSVLRALANQPQQVLWVGGQNGMEADLVARQGIAFTGIPAAGVHGVGLRSLPGNLLQLSRGTLQARRILRSFQPDVILFTGGFVAVPMALAGRRCPILLYVPDIEPGLALKTLARFADSIALTAEESRQYFSPRKHMVVTGYPIRPDLENWTRAEGRSRLGLDADAPVLLVFGGSKGARSINRALLAGLPRLLPQMQIIHISGELDWPEVQAAQAALEPELLSRYHAFPYLHEMGAALSAADLAVSRAGASTLGEYPLFGLPAILVPYPYAWRYQRVNAGYLQQRGAAVIIEDADLARQLCDQVETFMRQPGQLAAMRAAMRSLSQPQAAERIAGLALDLAAPGKGKG